MLPFQYILSITALHVCYYYAGTAELTSKTISPFVHTVVGLIRYEFSILCCVIGLLPSASCSFTTCLGIVSLKQSNCTHRYKLQKKTTTCYSCCREGPKSITEGTVLIRQVSQKHGFKAASCPDIS